MFNYLLFADAWQAHAVADFNIVAGDVELFGYVIEF
jgi:hypothetical protein